MTIESIGTVFTQVRNNRRSARAGTSRNRPSIGIVGVLLALALVGHAQAASDADKCEAAKNKIAGKYAFCRQKAEAKAIQGGTAPDFAKCDLAYSGKWTKTESAAGGMCPTNGDEAGVQAFIGAHSDSVAAALGGAGVPDCGDDLVNVAGEQCDGSDLDGETCVTLGVGSGSLACDGSCRFDTSGCSSGFPASGQTTAYGSGSDGDVEAGAPLAYLDNGDGTITDLNTRLMWEKKDGSGGVHGYANTYTWGMTSDPYEMDGTIATDFLATLNGGGGFAGYTDWRIPNVKELQSIVDYQASSAFFPAVHGEFHDSAMCMGGCSDLTEPTCSCTAADVYWTSSTDRGFPGNAWAVNFSLGFVFTTAKDGSRRVRAVRDAS